MERWVVAFGDRVAFAGSGVPWLVVDFEVTAAGPTVILERPGGDPQAAHPSALVVLTPAR